MTLVFWYYEDILFSASSFQQACKMDKGVL
jgi:hypothetical protein